jgi:hypothetical protein
MKVVMKPNAVPKDCTNGNNTKKLKKDHWADPQRLPTNKDECPS